MLQTSTGKTLPPELFLQTVSCMKYYPGMIEAIMRISPTLRELLSNYQHSMSRQLATHLSYHSSASYIRSSSPSRSLLSHSTFPWLHELHSRSITISRLRQSHLLSRAMSRTDKCARINPCNQIRFLSILYEISDHGAGQIGDHAQRDAQEAWIASSQRTLEELAFLHAMLHILSDCWRQMGGQIEIPDELDSPFEQEEECVYRECALVYGPYFLDASLGDQPWYQKVMSDGIKDLRSFERRSNDDRKHFRGSLQGRIARRICELAECAWEEVWTSIWRVLLEEVCRGM